MGARYRALGRDLAIWEIHLRSTGKSTHTIKSYVQGVRALAAWLTEEGLPLDPEAITTSQLRAFQAHLLLPEDQGGAAKLDTRVGRSRLRQVLRDITVAAVQRERPRQFRAHPTSERRGLVLHAHSSLHFSDGNKAHELPDRLTDRRVRSRYPQQPPAHVTHPGALDRSMSYEIYFAYDDAQLPRR